MDIKLEKIIKNDERKSTLHKVKTPSGKLKRKKFVFVCVMCQQRFSNHSALKDHLSRDHSKGDMPSTSCNSSIDSSGDTLLNTEQVTDRADLDVTNSKTPPILQTHNSYEAKSSTSVTNNAKRSQNPERNNENFKNKKKVFVCVMCKQMFPKHSILKEHFRQHGNKSIDMRGFPAHCSTLLKHPKKNADNIQLIECEFCPEVSTNVSKAIQHKFKKHKAQGRNYFCEFCGKLFPIKVAYEQHKLTVHSKAFETNEKLLEQKVIVKEEIDDMKEEMFKCSYCPAVFVTKDALNFHDERVHQFGNNLLLPQFVPPPSTKIKLNNSAEVFSVYYCHLCGSEYIMKFNLKKHLKDNHTQEEQSSIPVEGIIRCKTCAAIFYSEKAYTAHCVHHRPGDWHVTSEEQRQRIVARVDQDFDFRRIPLENRDYLSMLLTKNKRQQSNKEPEPSSSKSKEDSDDEPMSPPSSPSDSSDDERKLKPNIDNKS